MASVKRNRRRVGGRLLYVPALEPALQEWAKLVVEAIRANPMLTAKQLHREVGTPDHETLYKVLAAAALDELYPSVWSDDMQRRKDKVAHARDRGMLFGLLDTGDTKKAAEFAAFPLKLQWQHDKIADGLLRHISWKQARELAQQKAVTLREAVISDKLTDIVMTELDFEDNMSVALQSSRLEIARDLYQKSRVLWNRVLDFAQVAVVDKFTAAMIRALTEAASTAIKDAQLLSGKATDRVEGFVKAFRDMSDEELQSFVLEDVTVREIHQRELAPLESESELEVADAEFSVQQR